MSNHKWNFSAITLLVLVLALAVPTSALAGGGDLAATTDNITSVPVKSHPPTFLFPYDEGSASNLFGGRPWEYNLLLDRYQSDLCWQRQGPEDYIGVPDGYVGVFIQGRGAHFVTAGSINRVTAINLCPETSVVPIDLARRFPADTQDLAGIAGVFCQQCLRMQIEADHSLTWHFWGNETQTIWAPGADGIYWTPLGGRPLYKGSTVTNYAVLKMDGLRVMANPYIPLQR